MCTLVVSLQPAARCSLLVVAVRDEILDRPWAPPGHHWPDHPGLLGGRDLRAGGTWLALNPTARWVACVLNADGDPAPEPTRRSRGDLPLHAAAHGDLTITDPHRYDPFHLVLATETTIQAVSWNGATLTHTDLGPGTELFVNQGRYTGPDTAGPRADHFGPLFRSTRPEVPTDPAIPTAKAWSSWTPLITGDGLPPDDPSALIHRVTLPDGVTEAGTSSISLLAFGDTVRYEYTADVFDQHWHPVPTELN